ncbi:MAG TPA: aldo/keto reductase [Planctomycetota bacterium]|nr:aldo/keto reductase [Planctomycetota bacterium]
MAERDMTRRGFVRATAGLAAGVAVAARAEPEVDTKKILNYNPKMGYRRFGKSGVMISEVGLGGHWKNRDGGRYWASFAGDNPPPDVQMNRNEVWVKAAEMGINYYDITTAGEAAIYGRCAKQTGVKLHIGYSDHVLCMRNPANRTVEKLMVEIDAGLKRLMVDRMFLWRPQANMGGGHTKQELDNVLECFRKAKEQGKVEHLGMSTHNHAFVQQVIEQYGEHYGGFVFMYTVTNEPKASASMFETLKKKDCGAIGLKPFHGNSFFSSVIRDARKAGKEPDLNTAAITGLKKILEVPEMTCTIPGMTTVDEVENNVKASYERQKKLTQAERQYLAQIGADSLAHLPPDYAFIREQMYV